MTSLASILRAAVAGRYCIPPRFSVEECRSGHLVTCLESDYRAPIGDARFALLSAGYDVFGGDAGWLHVEERE
jgi:hypothetical protein